MSTPQRFQLSHLQQQRQQLQLLPQMLQAIEILELPTLELAGFLRAAYEKNEALVLGDPPTPHEPTPAPFAGSPRRRAAGQREHDSFLESQAAPGRSWSEELENELALSAPPPELEPWLRLLVQALDANGWLSLSDAEVLALARTEGLVGGEAELGRSIALLQSFEPKGLGARNLVEALLLQLDPKDPDYPLLCKLIEEQLDDLAANKLPRVARALGLELGELLRLVERLKELEPHPAAVLSEAASETLRADVLVEHDGKDWSVRVDRASEPAVRLNAKVQQLARDKRQDPQLRRYLRHKLEDARVLIAALEQRRATLLRVCVAIFQHQRQFLEQGPGHLTPLRMGELGEELGIHLSTVSRAVSGKNAQTPWGVLPLRHFFQASAGASEESARDDVRDQVRAVIDAEDPAAPLSDDEIVLAMESRGLHLARRTIAKYRAELDIPSSYRRRRYAS